MPGSKRCGRIF